MLSRVVHRKNPDTESLMRTTLLTQRTNGLLVRLTTEFTNPGAIDPFGLLPNRSRLQYARNGMFEGASLLNEKRAQVARA